MLRQKSDSERDNKRPVDTDTFERSLDRLKKPPKLNYNSYMT